MEPTDIKWTRPYERALLSEQSHLIFIRISNAIDQPCHRNRLGTLEQRRLSVVVDNVPAARDLETSSLMRHIHTTRTTTAIKDPKNLFECSREFRISHALGNGVTIPFAQGTRCKTEHLFFVDLRERALCAPHQYSLASMMVRTWCVGFACLFWRVWDLRQWVQIG